MQKQQNCRWKKSFLCYASPPSCTTQRKAAIVRWPTLLRMAGDGVVIWQLQIHETGYLCVRAVMPVYLRQMGMLETIYPILWATLSLRQSRACLQKKKKRRKKHMTNAMHRINNSICSSHIISWQPLIAQSAFFSRSIHIEFFLSGIECEWSVWRWDRASTHNASGW